MNHDRLKLLAGIDNACAESTISEMVQPQPGQAFGTNDQDQPTNYDSDQLSRTADMLYCATMVGGEELSQQVFTVLPQILKHEFNHCKWEYVAPKL